jgi:uncharacterized protein (DUF302 family)
MASRYNYAETVERLKAAIVSAGSTLFATLDQSAAAKSAGLELRPTTLLVFGNPKGGTQLMDAFPLSALDLPLKLVVWDEKGSVEVAYSRARVLAGRYGITGKDALLASLDRALETIVGTIAA